MTTPEQEMAIGQEIRSLDKGRIWKGCLAMVSGAIGGFTIGSGLSEYLVNRIQPNSNGLEQGSICIVGGILGLTLGFLMGKTIDTKLHNAFIKRFNTYVANYENRMKSIL